MSFGDFAGLRKAEEAAHKDKLRHQMHHDLCLLSAGSVNSRGTLDDTANLALKMYKLLWFQVIKEIP